MAARKDTSAEMQKSMYSGCVRCLAGSPGRLLPQIALYASTAFWTAVCLSLSQQRKHVILSMVPTGPPQHGKNILKGAGATAATWSSAFFLNCSLAESGIIIPPATADMAEQ